MSKMKFSELAEEFAERRNEIHDLEMQVREFNSQLERKTNEQARTEKELVSYVGPNVTRRVAVLTGLGKVVTVAHESNESSRVYVDDIEEDEDD